MFHEKNKAITFSYDDGVVQDRRLVPLLNKQSEVRELYKNHEVAVHTLTHPKLPTISDEEVIRQVEQDRRNLSELVGYEVVGMAYPGGGVNHDERVENLIRNYTGVRYCRTIECSGSFELGQDLYKFKPSVHHLEADRKTYEICKQFIEMKTDKVQLLYIWGHSYEMDFGDRWDELEEIFKLVSGREDIFYGINREVFGF